MASADSSPNATDFPAEDRFDPSDEAIVDSLRLRASTGDVFFARYQRHVRRVLVRALGADTELPDLVQDVFVSALSSIDQLKEPTLLKRWLSSIALYRARARMRELGRTRGVRFASDEELESLLFVQPVPEVLEALGKTEQVLASIHSELRRAFLLRFVEERELEEVAEALGVSLSTGKRRLRRAEQRFDTLARKEPALSELCGGDRSFRKRGDLSLQRAEPQPRALATGTSLRPARVTP